jgi:hypothetical protein
MARFYERNAWPVRAGVLGACAYVLIFAITATMIIEVNGPQLRYFTGKLDKAGYLREALTTYPSLEFLRGVAAPGDAVASIGNCSTAYAPAQLRFESLCTTRMFTQFLNTNIDCQPFQFLILPDDERSALLQTTIRERREATLLHDDGRFSVFRLGSCWAH